MHEPFKQSPVAKCTRRALFGGAIAGAVVMTPGCSFVNRFGEIPEGKLAESIHTSPNWIDGEFRNQQPTSVMIGKDGFVEAWWKFLTNSTPDLKPAAPLPCTHTDLSALDPSRDIAVWLGHSGLYFQLAGLRFLVDPVYSAYASPVSFINKSFEFRDGKPYKAGYRKFKMKTVAGTDDYASLAETVSRRAAEYEKYSEMAANGEPSSNYFGQKPDLLLMDGGRGQVSAAKAALAGTALADVPLYGMVKDDHHRTRAIVDSEGREIAINMNRGTFTFVTAIQDETHRFANAYRKQQMKQKSYSSTLTEVPGVGPKTAKALMTQFKSVSAVKEATPDQLENTPGVGQQMAQTIYEYFHPQG